MKVEIVDPTRYPDWDELLFSVPGASFFHTSAWARVLSESYGYTPLYFTVLEDGQLRALVPLMEVNSILTGKRGISLPFTDYCEPIVDEGIPFRDFLSPIIDYGKKREWKYIELRGARNLLADVPPFESYLEHTLDLAGDPEEIFSNFRDSTRRNVKKAVAQGVTVKISNDLGAIKEFYRLNCLTRKQHRIPPQPYHFFKKVYDRIISKGIGFVALACYNGLNIAGAVFFHFGGKAIYKYGASDKKYRDLRANNLVMWEGIKGLMNQDNKILSFGRTEIENTGLRQFKTGWGPGEICIHYYRYNIQKGIFLENREGIPVFRGMIFAKMPIPFLRLIAGIAYRHMG